MRKSNHRKQRVSTAAAAVGAIVTAGALTTTAATSAQAAPLAPGTAAHLGRSAATTAVGLAPMPEGTVKLSRDWFGTERASVYAYGLTPDSSHTVDLVNGRGDQIASFGTLTANSAGQASATFEHQGWLPLGYAHVVIRNGTADDPVSAEPIAQSSPYIAGVARYRLIPVEDSAAGAKFGVPQGGAIIRYNPVAQTITVTVHASGLTPGAHAAHIHVGSCAAQGPVQYMLDDFVADAGGRIANQTRTVTGVTTPPPATGWYFNLHQGDANSIQDAAGNPTIDFRPLLCGDISR